MPEGPEIRRAADELERVLEGEQALEVRFLVGALAGWGPRLSGRRIEAVTPRSKAMLIRFDNGQTLYSHNQLYGRWYVSRAGRTPRTNRALRLSIATRSHVASLYSATDIAVLDAAALAAHPYLTALGPDLLDAATSEAALYEHAAAPAFARRTLAGLLLDQRFYAGLGNYLRSEILHVARLRHDLRYHELDEPARRRLAVSALSLTRQAYRTRGITNDSARAARLKREGLAFAAYRHWVFDRDGQPCWTCAARIVRVDVAGRGVYYCPRCQDAPVAAPCARRRRPAGYRAG